MNVVHVGLQRTGNTTLQNVLLSRRPEFFYIGKVDDLYPDARIRELISRIGCQDSLEYDAGRTRAVLTELCQLNTGNKPLLVADEFLSVEGRADRRLVAERLRELFAPAKALIVLRSQLTLLPAIYMKHLSAIGTKLVSFESWLDQNYDTIRFSDQYRISLDYEALLRAYADAFGSDNVVVIPSELMHEPRSIYQVRLAALLRVPVDAVSDVMSRNVADQRVSRRHALAHRLQDVLPMEQNLAELGRRMLPRFLYEPVRRFVRGGSRVETPRLPEHWRRRIAELCAEGNARIAARWDLPLGDLGYPVPQGTDAAALK